MDAGFQALERNEHIQAEFFFNNVCKHDANAKEAMRGLAWTLYCQGRYEEALKIYLEYIRVAPDDFAAHEGAALTHFKLGHHEDAVHEMKIAASIDICNAEPYVLLSSFYRHMKDFPSAESCLAQAITLEPTSVDTYLEQGSLANAQGDLAGAFRSYQSAAEVGDGNFEVTYRLGRLYLQKKDYYLAQRSFTDTLALNPDWPDALYGLALAEIGLRHTSSAIQILEAVIHLKPGFQLAYVRLARLYLRSFQLGKYWKTIKRGVVFSTRNL